MSPVLRGNSDERERLLEGARYKRYSDEISPQILLESDQDRRKRYKSLIIVGLSGFVFNFAFSVVLTSAFPYLVQMEDGNEEGLHAFLGWVVAAQPLAQTFFGPLVGFLGNKMGSIRLLTMCTMSLLAVGFIFYACIHALPPPRKYYLIVARLLVGAAAGTTTLCFTYISAATRVKERTMAFGFMNFCLASSFVLGPVVQAVFLPLGDGIYMGSDLYLNKYTGSSWFVALLAVLVVILFLPKTFTEYSDFAKREGEMAANRRRSRRDGEVLAKPDYLAAVVCIVISSTAQFNFIFLETLGTPLTMGMLGWTDDQAMLYVGIAFAAGGLYSGIISATAGMFSHKMNERKAMIVGISLLLVGSLTFFPYSGPTPPRKWNVTEEYSANVSGLRDFSSTIMTHRSPDDRGGSTGCPTSQTWCDYTPAIRLEQMVAGFALFCTGYPLGNALSTAIFSKILGPAPQGIWMGILTGGGCIARFLCPILVANLYDGFGTRATFGFMAGLMAASLVLLFIAYRRLVPYRYVPEALSDRSWNTLDQN